MPALDKETLNILSTEIAIPLTNAINKLANVSVELDKDRLFDLAGEVDGIIQSLSPRVTLFKSMLILLNRSPEELKPGSGILEQIIREINKLAASVNESILILTDIIMTLVDNNISTAKQEMLDASTQFDNAADYLIKILNMFSAKIDPEGTSVN